MPTNAIPGNSRVANARSLGGWSFTDLISGVFLLRVRTGKEVSLG